MFLKNPRTYWKIAGVMFTSIVAPLSIRHYDTSNNSPIVIEPIPLITSFAASEELCSSNSTTRVVVQGNGSTPEEAFQNAIDMAVRQALESEVNVAEWNKYGPAYLASVRRDGTGLLHGWRELSTTSERHLTGRTYHSEVAVQIDEGALRQHLLARGRVTPP